jgi:hypothetical protein
MNGSAARFAAGPIDNLEYTESPAPRRAALPRARGGDRPAAEPGGGDAKFALTFEHRLGCLYAFVTGPQDSRAASTQFWNAVHRKAVALGASKVLVEEDFPNQLTTMEMFDVAEHVAKLFGGCVKIAHVDRHPSDLDLNKFGETVAVNRGLWARVFDNRADAEEWLKE